MRILLVGVFTSRGSTDLWKLKALRRLGHSVVTHEYRECDVSEQFQRGVPFDLVFVSKGVPLTAAQFAHLATLGTHRLLWWPDPFENWNEELSAAMRTGQWDLAATSHVVLAKIVIAAFAYSNGPHSVQNVVDMLRQAPDGHNTMFGRRVCRILEGCDCEGPRPEWQGPIEPALLHFGHLSERRKAIIETLRNVGIAVNVIERPMFGSELQKAVLRHAAVLGVNTSPDLYSNRVQTVLAMGGVMLQESDPRLPEDLALAESIAGPLGLWTGEAGALGAAARVLNDPIGYRNPGSAARVFARQSWNATMERALAFACPS